MHLNYQKMTTMTSEQRKNIRNILRTYLEKCEQNQRRIHYSQLRPISSLGDPPNTEFTTDCSGLVISAYRWADIWLPYLVKDPGGLNYSGWGYTRLDPCNKQTPTSSIRSQVLCR